MAGLLAPTFSMAPGVLGKRAWGSGGKSWLPGAYCYDGTICAKKDDHGRGIHRVHFMNTVNSSVFNCELFSVQSCLVSVALFWEDQIRFFLTYHSHVKYFIVVFCSSSPPPTLECVDVFGDYFKPHLHYNTQHVKKNQKKVIRSANWVCHSRFFGVLVIFRIKHDFFSRKINW